MDECKPSLDELLISSDSDTNSWQQSCCLLFSARHVPSRLTARCPRFAPPLPASHPPRSVFVPELSSPDVLSRKQPGKSGKFPQLCELIWPGTGWVS